MAEPVTSAPHEPVSYRWLYAHGIFGMPRRWRPGNYGVCFPHVLQKDALHVRLANEQLVIVRAKP